MRNRLSLTILGILAVCLSVSAQTGSKSSIGGKITLKGKPFEGIVVTLEGPPGEPLSEARVGFITKTDASGAYRFDDVPKGQHIVAPRAFAYVLPLEMNSNRPGRNITISAGENIEGVDYDLVPGAVITGTISDHRGQPAIGQRVQIWKAGNGPRPVPYQSLNSQIFGTDDRGVYRIYGMPAGKYVVSVGIDSSTSNISIGGAGSYSPIRYYPGTADRTQAKTVELSEGQEITEINITMAKPEKTYSAKGKVTDAETGAPVVGSMLGYGNIAPGGSRMGAWGFSGERTDNNGEFRLFGLKAGTYGVIIRPEAQSDYYVDHQTFEVRDRDVEDLEIRAKHGASIAGRVEIQDAYSSVDPSRIKGTYISASYQSNTDSVPGLNSAQIQPDGTFQMVGLAPGNVSLSVIPVRGIRLLRLERDGAKFPRQFDVVAGEKITGVRILLAQGNGVIKGQVSIVGGQLPQGMRFQVIGNRVDEPADMIAGNSGSIIVDALGRFTVEGLLPADYEIQILPISSPGGPSTKGISIQKQTVTVGAMPATVVFTFDASQTKGN